MPTVVLGAAVALWAVTLVAAVQAQWSIAQRGSSVIFISVDALRSDAVSLRGGGSGWDWTPELREQLGPRATVFTAAYSQAPWTLPAFSSMFTGRYPEEHRAEDISAKLDRSEVTLGEILRGYGFETMAVVSSYFLTKEAGVTQGFARVDESQADKSLTTTAAEVTDRALRFLKGARHERFFLFLHYLDTHDPYLAHRGFQPAVPGRPERGGGAKAAEQARTAADMRRRYASEVAFTDYQIGRLLRFLGEHDRWKSTCVILVADHGDEALGYL